MKLQHYSFSLLAISLNFANAQVQINSDDVYAPGTYQIATAKTGGFNIGTSGENKVWDFSGLQKDQTYNFNLSAYQSSGNKPDANFIRTEGTDTFEYIKKSHSTMYEIRSIVNFSEINYYPIQYLQFPMAYNHSIMDSIDFIYYYKGSDLGVDKDSVRLVYHEHKNTIADAWGKLKLPNGEYDALRIKTTDKFKLYMEGKSGSESWAHVDGYDYDESITDYNWYTNNKGTVLATYNVESDAMNFMVSANIGIKHRAPNENGVCFLNPMSEAWKVRNPGKKEITIRLYDGTGKTVKQENLLPESELIMNTSYLNNGIYYMETIDSDGIKQGFKVMK
ncbi:MAG: T9SS type A sorting domain-containing protein [Bacteroidetes bacterium]|nr:T9SS type A sorting domain-containing protein [Bacteroidota bacterium]